MIYRNNIPVIGIFKNNIPIIKVYRRGYLIWELKTPEEQEIIKDILSCYSNGYWIDEYPWTDNTPWTD